MPNITPWKRWFAIYSSPLAIPFHAIIHTRVVVSDPEGNVYRYDIHRHKNKQRPELHYLHVNNQPADEWFPRYLWTSRQHHPSRVLYQIVGEEWSIAHRVFYFVQEHVYQYQYQYKHRYWQIPWPNCNTFTQWILNAFPEINFSLPWNARWKSYRVR